MRRYAGVMSGAAALVIVAFGSSLADACSRVLWADNGQAVVTGRNMDWPEDMRTDLWAFPRGLTRKGASGDNNELTWTSKYGSVGAADLRLGDCRWHERKRPCRQPAVALRERLREA